MDKITILGIDLAKSVFQLHGVDAQGCTVLRRQLRRSQMLEFFQHLPSCLIGIEACASAHYWARELAKFGHEVRLMQPSYVKGYVKRGKTDAADAEAFCEAVSRPSMRFVPVKSEGYAGASDDAQGTGISGASADPDCERHARAPGRVRDCRAQGHP
jgi:transposase